MTFFLSLTPWKLPEDGIWTKLWLQQTRAEATARKQEQQKALALSLLEPTMVVSGKSIVSACRENSKCSPPEATPLGDDLYSVSSTTGNFLSALMHCADGYSGAACYYGDESKRQKNGSFSPTLSYLNLNSYLSIASHAHTF